MSRELMETIVAHVAASARVFENVESSSRLKGKGTLKSKGTSVASGSCSPTTSRTYHLYRDLNGEVTSSVPVTANEEFYRELEAMYNSIDSDTDLYHVFLESWYDEESREVIRDVTRGDLPFRIGMYRLVESGMVIGDAFFILALVKFLRET